MKFLFSVESSLPCGSEDLPGHSSGPDSFVASTKPLWPFLSRLAFASAERTRMISAPSHSWSVAGRTRSMLHFTITPRIDTQTELCGALMAMASPGPTHPLMLKRTLSLQTYTTSPSRMSFFGGLRDRPRAALLNASTSEFGF